MVFLPEHHSTLTQPLASPNIGVEVQGIILYPVLTSFEQRQMEGRTL